MNPFRDVPPLEPGCPWSSLAPPNIKWCEANVCGWITTPANTWSNLAFLIVAAVLWRRARGIGGSLALFAPAAAAVGLCSFAFHASYTFLFQFFDYAGMFTFTLLMLSLNLRRLGTIDSDRATLAVLVSGVALSSALVLAFHAVGLPVQLIVLGQMLGLVAQEIWIAAARGPRARYRWYGLAMALLVAAMLCSVLDATRVWCNPDDHVLQGHAVWHVLCALMLWALFPFYAQFDQLRGRPRA